MSLSLTVVVLTYNEERNLPECLASLEGLRAELVVVDSGSTDRTLEIAGQFNAKVVRHSFETHARQWRWALANVGLSTEWVLALDADQRLTPSLREEIGRTLAAQGPPGGGPAGFFVRRRQIFRGRWIRHGGYYPKYLLKLFRADQAWVDAGELVDHHFRVKGDVARLAHDLIEENRNEADISAWVAKHNRYAMLQALQEFEAELRRRPPPRAALFGSPDERVEWLKRVWARLPLYLRPCLYFVYRYVFRLGFLDGTEGFVFHALQAFWYRLLVDIRLDELRRGRSQTRV